MAGAVRTCTRCLYPAHHPFGLTFDAAEVCSGCRIHEEKDRLDWTERAQRLAGLLDAYRGRSPSGYDCVVPVSGARDSFFIVHTLRKVHGLTPLLVTYNRHYNSAAGIYNIARLRTVLGCDMLGMTLAPESVRRLIHATLDRRGSLHWQALAGATVFPVQVAVRLRIPLIVWGHHQGLDQTGMFSHRDEVEMTRRYRKEHDLMGLEPEDLAGVGAVRESDVAPLAYPPDAALLRAGVRGIYLGNYLRWDTKAQHERMLPLYGYYTGPLARTFDTYNDVDCLHYAGLHDVIKVRKLGYGKATDHACREIRFGRLSRAEGAALAAVWESRPLGDALPGDAVRDLLAWLDLSERDLFRLVERHRHPALAAGHGPAADTDAADAADAAAAEGRLGFRRHRPADLADDPQAARLLTKGHAEG